MQTAHFCTYWGSCFYIVFGCNGVLPKEEAKLQSLRVVKKVNGNLVQGLLYQGKLSRLQNLMQTEVSAVGLCTVINLMSLLTWFAMASPIELSAITWVARG